MQDLLKMVDCLPQPYSGGFGNVHPFSGPNQVRFDDQMTLQRLQRQRWPAVKRVGAHLGTHPRKRRNVLGRHTQHCQRGSFARFKLGTQGDQTLA